MESTFEWKREFRCFAVGTECNHADAMYLRRDVAAIISGSNSKKFY